MERAGVTGITSITVSRVVDAAFLLGLGLVCTRRSFGGGSYGNFAGCSCTHASPRGVVKVCRCVLSLSPDSAATDWLTM